MNWYFPLKHYKKQLFNQKTFWNIFQFKTCQKPRFSPQCMFSNNFYYKICHKLRFYLISKSSFDKPCFHLKIYFHIIIFTTNIWNKRSFHLKILLKPSIHLKNEVLRFSNIFIKMANMFVFEILFTTKSIIFKIYFLNLP